MKERMKERTSTPNKPTSLRDTIFIKEKQKTAAVEVPKQCQFVLLVKVGWKERKM
jgi:hypothetical protein